MGIDLSVTLRELRKRYGYTQAEVVRILNERGCESATSSVSRWEIGRSNPSIEQFIALCEIYHVGNVPATFRRGVMPPTDTALNEEGRRKVQEYRDLLIGSGKYAPDDKVVPFRKRQAPFYENEASAGFGVFTDSSEFEMVDVGDEVPPSANFGLRIRGDSMEPACHNGDSIWVHQQPVLEDGDLGLFVYEGQGYMKQYSKNSSTGVRLVSLNPEYKPIVISEGDDIHIMGKVVAITSPKR